VIVGVAEGTADVVGVGVAVRVGVEVGVAVLVTLGVGVASPYTMLSLGLRAVSPVSADAKL